MRSFVALKRMLWRALGVALMAFALLPGGGCLNIAPLAQCLEQSDCNQARGETCKEGICVSPTPPPPSCQRACTSDADCASAGCTNTSCMGGACVALKWHTVTRNQSANKAIDILFVVDNSGSMKEEQEKLARNFEKFIQVLTNRDINNYQIGIISTDMDSPLEKGRLQAAQGQPKIISRSNLPAPKVIEAFKANIALGIRGTSYEKPLDAMRAALSPKLLNDATANKGFLRPDAMLAVFFVGDEDDCSHNGSISETELDSEVCRLPKAETLKDDQGNPIPDAKGKPIKGHMEDLTPTSEYISFLKSLNREVYVSGLIGDPIVYRTGTQTPVDPAGGCKAHLECTIGGERHKCIFNSPSTRKCGGCTSVLNPSTSRPDADAVPGFRLFDLIEAFGGSRAWYPICGDDSGFQQALLGTAHQLSDRFEFVVLSPPPLAGAEARFQVEIVGKDGSPVAVVPRATSDGKSCALDSDCSGGHACGGDGKCYADGWVFYPGATTDPGDVPRLRLSGSNRAALTPGRALKVTYPIAP